MAMLQRGYAGSTTVMRLCVALAFVAASAYLLIAQGILAVGDLEGSERPAGIVYAAAIAYAIGGLLILLRLRWLWIAGAAVNALVMLFFLQMYLDRTSVLFSAGGLVTKTAQLLLEVGLIYLILADRPVSAGSIRPR